MGNDTGDIIRAVKGVKDILPEDLLLWRLVRNTAETVFTLYGFGEIRVPVFERTEVFKRSIGESTDIVQKEMYTFEDRGKQSLTLRPEGTASVVRAYIEHRLYDPPGIKKLFYSGPMFRAERPQAGRFRQFHQVGAEIFGSDDPMVDSEIITMLVDFLGELNLPGLKVVLNSLGCHDCRPGYRDTLYGYLSAHKAELCDTCLDRIEKNPMRVLDCKSEGCKTVAKNAPTIDKSRCEACETHFAKVIEALKTAEVSFEIDPRLVRGLDYYNRTAFEVVAEGLGAQNAVAGGGRYDSLVRQMGGPDIPAIGFAVGLERLISLLPAHVKEEAGDNAPDIYLIALGEQAQMAISDIARNIRMGGFICERSFGQGSLKSNMRKANRSGARAVLIIGDDEMEKNSVVVRDMKKGDQELVLLSDLPGRLEDIFDE